ncbi:MAG: acyltransferase [Methanobrevibacter millerae]|uniref:Acyltransferase n=1 Tax=Methanobrevibacter millerae TaxID=230361 RepID=A0A8T3VCL3_9EURY|nr:acyltransferase [Methanobrevibacter millerae]
MKEKESKLKNQSNELNYLTNTIIPDLKKENSNLKSLKVELTNALDKTSRKYYDQLDINEDLSNRIGELGADNAVSKARSDRLESELQSIRDDYEEKIKSLEVEISNLEASDVDELEKINQNLRDDLKTSNDELDDTKKQNEELRAEVDDLRKKLIEMGDYKEEVDENAKKSIDKLKDEIVSLKSELKIKQSNYDKLSNESQKTIADLRNQIERLKNDSEKKSDKGGFFDRFK